MTLLPSVLSALGSRNELPPLKLLPSISNRDEWLPSPIIYPSAAISTSNHRDAVVLPPISLPPLTSPYSCSSSSSSLSSPDSVSATLFPTFTEQQKHKKGSIESLLNSGSELRALEHKKTKIRHAPYHHHMKKMKGLRLFSKQVCDKVAEKGITTYNEVADELTSEIQQQHRDVLVDQKNIRRRVYDALNVLMALDIIIKDRKQIKWLGIPNNNDYEQQLTLEIQKENKRQQILLESIQQSKHALNETLQKYTRLDHLVSRNRLQEEHQGGIYLPFFMITSDQSIETNNNSVKEASFDLGSSWSIYQDADILAKLWPTTTTISSS